MECYGLLVIALVSYDWGHLISTPTLPSITVIMAALLLRLSVPAASAIPTIIPTGGKAVSIVLYMAQYSF